jgi:hypothetical protein
MIVMGAGAVLVALLGYHLEGSFEVGPAAIRASGHAVAPPFLRVGHGATRDGADVLEGRPRRRSHPLSFTA